jgi:hypothetical protein
MDNRERPTFFPTDVPVCRMVSPRPRQWVRAVLAALGITAAAFFGLSAPALAQALDQSRSQDGSIQVEEHVGWQDPLGAYGLALVFDRGGRFSGGFGVRPYSIKSDTLPPLGFFGRMRLLRWGWGSLGVGVALSRERVLHEQLTGQERDSWSWYPGYRATGTVGAEFAHRAWSIRFDAGIGYMLNGPQCTVNGPGNYVVASCDSPRIPAAVRTASQDARLIPSLTTTIGYRFATPSWPGTPSVDVAPGYKFPSTALHLSLWSTLVPALAGAAMLYLSVAKGNDIALALGGAATMGLGLSFGPSIGHAYSDEPRRAWGGGALRLVGFATGILVFVSALAVDEQTHTDDPKGQALGACLISAAVISAIYDISAAPSAARRANARNGLSNLSLAPVAVPGRGSPSPGLSLVGRF